MSTSKGPASKLSKVDFQPLTESEKASLHDQATLVQMASDHSYWQQVWQRFKTHRLALISLFLLALILIFAVAGPWLWPVAPGQQNISEVSLPPAGARRALVVDIRQVWSGVSIDVRDIDVRDNVKGANFEADTAVVEALAAPQSLRLHEANTERVQLSWQPVVGASGYRVYRNIKKPASRWDLGLPLGKLTDVSRVSYEDKLKLQARSYYYSVIAYRSPSLSMVDGGKQQVQGSVYSTIEVNPVQAISLLDVQLNNKTGEIFLDAGLHYLWFSAHPLGTDYLGRDILARLIHGARISLTIGIVGPLLIVFFGSIYGAVAGHFGGKVDEILMRFADFVIALPFLLFMILFKVILGVGPGSSGVLPMLFALVLLSWPATARLIRGQVLQLRSEAYVQAARLFGRSQLSILWWHMLPNTLGLILVAYSFAVPTAIFAEAFLSFIGLGISPPTPSWGTMCNDGMRTFLNSPHELVFPAIMISLTVLVFNLLGDGLRDALDVKMQD